MPTRRESDGTGNAPDVRVARLPGDARAITLTGNWSTLGLVQRDLRFKRALARYASHPWVSWDLSRLEKLDHTGALPVWRA